MINRAYYEYCPVCGRRIVYLEDENRYICTNSSCRTTIVDDTIGNIDLMHYAELQEKYNFNNKSMKRDNRTFMLLKENLSGPMLTKNTNEPLMKLRNTYCIVKANNKDDALKQFKEKYKIIKITEEMVVEIEIKEI